MRNSFGSSAIALVILTIGLALSASGAPWQDSCSAAFRQFENDIPSLYLINGLFLSPEQYDQLTELLKEAEGVNEQYEASIEQMQDDFMDTFLKQAGREIRHGKQRGGLREEVQSMRSVHEKRQRQLRNLAVDLYAMLTPAQREIIDGFEPCFIPAKDFREPVRVGQAANDTSFGEKIFERLRMVPEHRLDYAKERALQRMVPYVMHKRHIEYTEDDYAKVQKEISDNLEAALPRIRDLNDVDYELEKSALVQQVLPVDRTPPPHIQRSGGDVDYEGALLKISHYVLNPGCIDVVVSRGTMGRQPGVKQGSSPAGFSESSDRLRAMRLVAGLALTPAQAGKVLPIVQDGVAARRQLEADIARTKEEALPAYAKLRSELDEQNPTQETENHSNHYHISVKRMYEEQLVETLKPYENRLDQVLTAGQVERLTATREPPQPGQKPKGGGQQERKMAMELLDDARDMNPAEFERSKHDMCSRFVQSCLIYDKDPGGVDREYETERAVSVLEQARTMIHSQYRKSKLDLATELCPRRSAPRSTVYTHKFMKGEPLEGIDVTSQLLFSEAAVEVLTELAKR